MSGHFNRTPTSPVKVQTELFSRVLRASEYWVGICNHFGKVTFPAFEAAAGELVAAAYIDEQKIYPEDRRLQLLGHEEDPEQLQAQRFVVLKRSTTEGWAELFAAGRNITREQEHNDPLPIQTLFPDLFKNQSETVGSVEISRVVSRYPADKDLQHLGLIALMRTSFALAKEVDAPYVYAATEQFVVDAISDYGLPMEQIGEPRQIQEGRESLTSLIPLRFDVGAITQVVDEDHPDFSPLVTHYLQGIDHHMGLGFFNLDLVATADTELAMLAEPTYPAPLYPEL